LQQLSSLHLSVLTDWSPQTNSSAFQHQAPPHKVQTQQIQPSLQLDIRLILAAVGQLTQLTHLHLSIDPKDNGGTHRLRGIGSRTFGPLSQLTQLASLSLSFSAAAPGSGLSQISVLTSLTQLSLADISTNSASGVVEAIGDAWDVLQLQRLELRSLGVKKNKLALEKVQPQHLRVLDVASNDLGKLSEQLRKLTALQVRVQTRLGGLCS
jgi:hypothetical protein